MKRAVNFRLSNQATTTLSILEKRMHTSKTEVIEQALKLYAKTKLPQQEILLGYAGILSKDEADKMLHDIRSNRRNKNLEVKL